MVASLFTGNCNPNGVMQFKTSKNPDSVQVMLKCCPSIQWLPRIVEKKNQFYVFYNEYALLFKL